MVWYLICVYGTLSTYNLQSSKISLGLNSELKQCLFCLLWFDFVSEVQKIIFGFMLIWVISIELGVFPLFYSYALEQVGMTMTPLHQFSHDFPKIHTWISHLTVFIIHLLISCQCRCCLVYLLPVHTAFSTTLLEMDVGRVALHSSNPSCI